MFILDANLNHKKNMKKVFALLTITALLFAACGKEDDDDTPAPVGLNPTQTQWGWTLEYTRTNCSTCGSKGGPLIHQMHGLGKVVAIAAHVTGGQDPMETTLHQPFQQDRPSGGSIPSFWVGNTKVGLSGTEAVDAMKALKTQVPCAGVDMSYTINGDIMTVKTKTKFFSAQTGEFKLGVILLEDGIDGGESSGAYNQAGASDYTHNFVLRAVAAGSAYGEVIITSPASGKVIEKEYTFNLTAGWVKKNCYPVAMIWKYDAAANPKHQYINAFEKKN